MDEIIFNEIPGKNMRWGEIKLNRPRSLNALTHTMITRFFHHALAWANNPKIGGIVIRSLHDNAFCAGGDIRYIYDEGKTQTAKVLSFFSDEYRLNHLLFHYPKPFFAFLNGLTMGGGVGISVYANHRFVTERYLFGMPEARIGFFPDIGASYFLSRLTKNMGSYLALTGEKLNAHGAISLGLADHLIESHATEEILAKLFETDIRENTDRVIKDIIQPHRKTINGQDFEALTHKVNDCFNSDKIDDILSRLQKADAWGQDLIKKISFNSPTSLKVICAQLAKGKNLSFDECLKMEYTMVQHFLQGSDFYEGVRAVIIDKDQKPRWEPPTLDQVTPSRVDTYFQPTAQTLSF